MEVCSIVDNSHIIGQTKMCQNLLILRKHLHIFVCKYFLLKDTYIEYFFILVGLNNDMEVIQLDVNRFGPREQTFHFVGALTA
jgi:hypothetical protein